jgi:hypothetical protein
MNMTKEIISYENGSMNEAQVIAFFQKLINTGLCWRLQGHYGRMAMQLIEEGLCNEQQ